MNTRRAEINEKKTKTAREFLITKQASTGVAPVLGGNKACSQQDCSVFGQEGKGPSAQVQVQLLF